MARISGRLMHRTNPKLLLSQLVMTQPPAGTTEHSVGYRAAMGEQSQLNAKSEKWVL
jgi:hypothetical protein